MFCQNCGKEIVADSQFCQSCGQPIGSAYTVTSLGRRLANYFLDGVFVAILNIIIAIGLSTHSEYNAFFYFTWATSLLYYIVFEGIWQRTPAKWITGTKVVTKEGLQPSFGRIVGRSLCRYIPFDAFSFLFGAPVGWHDTISKTLVVPAEYTPEQVQHINLAAHPRSKGKTILIVFVVVIVGIAILGLLTSVVLLSLNSAREKSRDAKRVADVRQLGSALDLYYNDKTNYPATLEELYPNYLSYPVVEPTPADGGCTAQQNTYTYSATGKTFTITFCLGENTGGYSAGVNKLTPKGIEGTTPFPDFETETPTGTDSEVPSSGRTLTSPTQIR